MVGNNTFCLFAQKCILSLTQCFVVLPLQLVMQTRNILILRTLCIFLRIQKTLVPFLIRINGATNLRKLLNLVMSPPETVAFCEEKSVLWCKSRKGPLHAVSASGNHELKPTFIEQCKETHGQKYNYKKSFSVWYNSQKGCLDGLRNFGAGIE